LIWTELMGENREKRGLPLSVHMSDFPKADEALIDTDLEESMDMVERIVSLGRAARSRKNLKVRQPLAKILVALPGKMSFDRISDYMGIIRDELNVKDVAAMDDAGSFVTFAAKLNFKVAGPRLGSTVKAVGRMVGELDNDTIAKFLRTKEVALSVDGREVKLHDDDLEVLRIDREGFAYESDNLISVALVTELTDELIDEGFAREMVNKIQNMRKTLDFNITDRVAVRVRSTDRVKAAAQRHDQFIRQETLADSIEFVEDSELEEGREWSLNGESTAIAVQKA
jgi:isoleucyl-tRNA synthetase